MTWNALPSASLFWPGRLCGALPSLVPAPVTRQVPEFYPVSPAVNRSSTG